MPKRDLNYLFGGTLIRKVMVLPSGANVKANLLYLYTACTLGDVSGSGSESLERSTSPVSEVPSLNNITCTGLYKFEYNTFHSHELINSW